MNKMIRNNPTVREWIIGQEDWDVLYNQYRDFLFEEYGVDKVPFVSRQGMPGFENFILHGKIVTGAIL